MANRSYIYLKNGDEARILTAGIYTIPYFWQLFWDEEDLRTPISLWETAEKLEEDEEQAEKFYQEQNLDILLPIAKFQQNALQNRSFLEENAPRKPCNSMMTLFVIFLQMSKTVMCLDLIFWM